MKPDDFRRLALSMPGSVEGAHRNHPDFRVCKKVFATLGYPDDHWGMVKLTPAQQEMIVAAEPDAFKPVGGAWGRRGCTQVLLEVLDESRATDAIRMAWTNVVPG